MEIRNLKDDQMKCVTTRNTWTEEKLQKAREYLEAGYYVTGDSDCIGHTLAAMVAREFINIFRKEYGERIEVVERDGYGDLFIHLK